MGNNTSLEAVKQELCKIHPSIPSRVKWDGDKVITDKWVKTRPVLIEAQDNENASIDIDGFGVLQSIFLQIQGNRWILQCLRLLFS
mmetsp:Transcript_46276/g.90346  ORF Transcript_46276/g.90346 Transcript_46276/m.90346 type:complete len:86 (+) Transcript_46276:894-1151(+)